MNEQHQEERLAELIAEFSGQAPEETDKGIEDAAQQEIYESFSAQSQNIEHLREQLQTLLQEIILQRKTNEQNNVEELSVLQAKYELHESKIENLERSQKIISTGAMPKRKQQYNGFGLWGWVFLGSNVLLWSVLGWFMWTHYGGEFSNTHHNGQQKKLVEDYAGLEEVITEDLLTAQKPTADVGIIESTEIAPISQPTDAQENSSPVITKQKTTVASRPAKAQRPTKLQNTASQSEPEQQVELTQAQIYYKKLREKKYEDRKAAAAKAKEAAKNNASQSQSERQPSHGAADAQPLHFDE